VLLTCYNVVWRGILKEIDWAADGKDLGGGNAAINKVSGGYPQDDLLSPNPEGDTKGEVEKRRSRGSIASNTE